MHMMELISDNVGTEEWGCPICGRRVAITWEPWKRTILEPGDVYAAHSGSRGGLGLESSQITQNNVADDRSSVTELSANDPYLTPWQKWVNKSGWTDLWNKED